MDDTTKRLLLAFALTMGIWLVFQSFFAPPPPSPPPPRPATQTQTKPTAMPPAPNGRTEELVAQEELATVKGSAWRATLSTQGAALKSLVLLHPRYVESRPGKSKPVPIDLVQVADPPYPVEADFGPGLAVAAPWKLEQASATAWRFSRKDDHARLTKTYLFTPESHMARVQLRADNLGTQPMREQLVLRVFGRQDPKAAGPGMFNPNPRFWTGVCHANGEVQRFPRTELDQEKAFLGEVRWAGVDDKYFLLAVAPVAESSPVRCTLKGGNDGRITTALEMASREVPAGGHVEREFQVYMGPKVLEELDAVVAANRDVKLGDAVNYGWLEVLCRPMIWLLKRFYSWVSNWGIAIIMLTIVVKLATLYWTQKGMKSMRAMAKVAPEVKRMQEKFKDDRNRLNQEVMNLYKRHGVNPLGGCLPMLLQMPIWIALYKTLSESVELYRSSFALWIRDLAVPDQYFILPGLLGVLSLGQTWLQSKSSPPSDPNQKMMMWMMPGMFVMFSLFVPAGLTLYWLVNTVLTMVHQWLMNRSTLTEPARA